MSESGINQSIVLYCVLLTRLLTINLIISRQSKIKIRAVLSKYTNWILRNKQNSTKTIYKYKCALNSKPQALCYVWKITTSIKMPKDDMCIKYCIIPKWIALFQKKKYTALIWKSGSKALRYNYAVGRPIAVPDLREASWLSTGSNRKHMLMFGYDVSFFRKI